MTLLLQQGMLDGVLGGSADVCLTETPDFFNDHLPVNVFPHERSETTGDDAASESARKAM